mmetsp:Transcript_13151/g.19681  ORF Transcript_13151/g.19681 Transcript_13151/m.19681 type:complete len:235 (+) Transcript_13151:115-819(+)
MKAIEILIIGALARSVEGSGGVDTCAARSALWINPSLCTATNAAASSKCSETQVLSAPNYELFEVLPEEKCTEEENKCMVHDFTLPWEMTDDKVQSALTKLMVWASLTRDMEMQKDRELCDSESDMPWGIQMCMDDTATSFKQVHRTQPILSYTPSILDPKNRQHHPTMTPMPEKKERKHSMAFGLPREKGSILTPSSNEGRNKRPLMAPSIGESRINLSYGLKVGSVAVDAMK